jgi:hypothetical protein
VIIAPWALKNPIVAQLRRERAEPFHFKIKRFRFKIQSLHFNMELLKRDIQSFKRIL